MNFYTDGRNTNMVEIETGSAPMRADSVGLKKVEVKFTKTYDVTPHVLVSWSDNENVFDFFTYPTCYYASPTGFTAIAKCTTRHPNSAFWWLGWVAIKR